MTLWPLRKKWCGPVDPQVCVLSMMSAHEFVPSSFMSFSCVWANGAGNPSCHRISLVYASQVEINDSESMRIRTREF